MGFYYKKPERIEFDENKHDYTNAELEQLADQFLRDQADSVDPETGKRIGIKETDNLPAILFESHIRDRKRREILTVDPAQNGVVDPAYTRDPRYPHQVPIYNRVSPVGRKVSTEKQRRESGSSFYL